MKKFVVVFFAAALAATQAFAAGTGAMDILKVPSGMKAQGMAGAYIAVADDVESLDINPAGLASVKGNEVMFVHDLYIDDIFYDSVYYANGSEGAGFSAVFKYMNTGSITSTLENDQGNYAGDGADISGMDFLASAGYGTNLGKLMYNDLTKNINIGAALAFTGEMIGPDYSNFAVSLNLGAIYTITIEDFDFMTNRGDTIWNKICVGIVMKNLGTSFGESGMTPMSFGAGAFTQWLNLFSSSNRLKLSADTEYGTGNGFNIRSGVDYMQIFGDYNISLRAGYNFNPEDRLASGIALGAGFGMKFGEMRLALDYIYSPYGELGTSNKIGLYFKF
ncbi:MAG: UPF0164 family protein [Spirochaetia bacterium]|nr:UPF0164 family protein [Spirochaetia bacterium]